MSSTKINTKNSYMHQKRLTKYHISGSSFYHLQKRKILNENFENELPYQNAKIQCLDSKSDSIAMFPM